MYLLNYSLSLLHLFYMRIDGSCASVKLQNGKESRKEKKDRRKEKNREKKDKKENRKRSREDHGNFEPSKHSPKKRKHDEGKGCPAKAGDDGSEQLEKSSITEELGLPLSTYSPYDSDRSQNTKQRENPAATAPSINHNNGRSADLFP